MATLIVTAAQNRGDILSEKLFISLLRASIMSCVFPKMGFTTASLSIHLVSVGSCIS
jgi:hypothetical protein